MNADDLAHGLDWSGEDLTGWYLSEKFDGCRAFWDGARMWTRQGNEIALPDWFRSELPIGVRLDGEMWCGRGKFAKASAGVRFGRIDDSFRFVIFDAPDSNGDWLQRISTIRSTEHTHAVRIWVSHDNISAIDRMKMVQGLGGEGLIARRPGVPYAPGRSGDILKLKRVPVPAEPSPGTTFSFELS